MTTFRSNLDRSDPKLMSLATILHFLMIVIDKNLRISVERFRSTRTGPPSQDVVTTYHTSIKRAADMSCYHRSDAWTFANVMILYIKPQTPGSGTI